MLVIVFLSCIIVFKMFQNSVSIVEGFNDFNHRITFAKWNFLGISCIRNRFNLAISIVDECINNFILLHCDINVFEIPKGHIFNKKPFNIEKSWPFLILSPIHKLLIFVNLTLHSCKSYISSTTVTRKE